MSKNITDEMLIELAIDAVQQVFEMEALGDGEKEITDDEFGAAHEKLMLLCARFFNGAVSQFHQKHPDTDLGPNEILHVMSCSGCRRAMDMPSSLH